MGIFNRIIAAVFVFITFQWDANPPMDEVAFYRIYQDNNGEVVVVADNITATTTTIDVTRADLSESEYFVTAIDGHGYESDESNRVDCKDAECRAAHLAPRKIMGVGFEGRR